MIVWKRPNSIAFLTLIVKIDNIHIRRFYISKQKSLNNYFRHSLGLYRKANAMSVQVWKAVIKVTCLPLRVSECLKGLMKAGGLIS
jgi:hypothetical protein